MGWVVHRTTIEYIASVNTPDYSPAIWIINPDLSLLLDIVPWKYWKVSGDSVLEMSQAEKDVVDGIEDAEQHHRDFEFSDEFITNSLVDIWGTPILVGANSVLLIPKRIRGGIVTLKAGDAADRLVVHNQGGKAFMLARSCLLNVNLETAQLADSYTEVGLSVDAVDGLMSDDVVKFTRDGTGNWFARCISGSSETYIDTGVAAVDDEYLHLEIKMIDGSVSFRINGVLVATIDTNVPDDMLEIYIGQKTTTGSATRLVRVDRVWGSSRTQK